MATVPLDDPVEFQDLDVSDSEQPPAELGQREETERSMVDQPTSTMRNELWHCVRKCDLKTFLQKIPQPYFDMIYMVLFAWVAGDFLMDSYLSTPVTGKYSLIIERFRAAVLAAGVLLSWPLLFLYPKMAWAKGRVSEEEITDLFWRISKYEVLHAVYESIPQCCISSFILINEGSFHFLDVVRIVISLMIATMIICKFLADSSAKCRGKFNVLNFGFCETMCFVIVSTPLRLSILTNSNKSTLLEEIQEAPNVWVIYFACFRSVLGLCIAYSAVVVPIGFHFHKSSSVNLGYVQQLVDGQYCLQFMFSAISMILFRGYYPQITFVFVFSTIISALYMILKVGPKRAVGVVTFVTLFCLIAGAAVLAIIYFIPEIYLSVTYFIENAFQVLILPITIAVVLMHHFPGCSRPIEARL